MLIVISPAKTLDFENQSVTEQFSQPDFLKESKKINASLKKLSKSDIGNLMNISEKLAGLNYQRFKKWKPPFDPNNAKQSLLAFKGGVYLGLDAESFREADFTFAQSHLRILSGLYGILKPLDLIQPYRLEMGTKFAVNGSKNLYDFWKEKLTPKLQKAIKESGSDTLINLASNEYFKAIDTKKLDAQIITPIFKENKNGKYKVISFLAKKARGMMSAFIIKNKITNPEDIKGFDVGDYVFNPEMSSDTEWVFRRG